MIPPHLTPRTLFLRFSTMALAAALGCNGARETDPQLGSSQKGTTKMNEASHKHTNHLINATSPYLLQHAHNPVDWYPWGADALAKAKKEDKPIFLSIGYSSCHWCHVMERESFENEEIARLMNEKFVSIKVDREERPDVDEIYMNAVQMLTGSGGWPLSVFLTPGLKPYLGGTYFPPEDKFGRPGFKRVLLVASKMYAERRDDVVKQAAAVTRRLEQIAAGPGASARIDVDLVAQAVRRYRAAFDGRWGGFGGAPKFPPSGAIALLLRHHHRSSDKDALQMATVTLDRMASGGMYDQLGGGFHRYSVDHRWLVPHFEKMLYDNALLAAVYLDAYRVTGKPFYRRVARETLDYVLRVMTDEGGAFHSAQDADSEGEEGKYYVWSPEEIEKVLGEKDAGLLIRYYGVTEDGNFEGRNILHLPASIEEFVRKEGLKLDEFRRGLDGMKQKLLAARDRRVPPGKDDKVLTDWNGLMISAMARGYQVLGDEKYHAAAERAADFIFTRMRPKGRLLHTYRAGRSHIDAYLDDYAFMLQASIDLYEATFDVRWIDHANSLLREMTDKLWDEGSGGFFSTPKGKADLLVRGKDAHDSALPAGNAIAAHALLRLARLTDDQDYLAKAEKTLSLFLSHAARAPRGFARLLSAVDFRVGPSREIVISGGAKDARTARLLAAVRGRYLPNAVVALIDPRSASAGAAVKALPLLESRLPVDGKPAAYVCENYACKAPVTSADALVQLLEERPSGR